MNTKSTIATAVVGVTMLGGVAVAGAAPRTASTAADDCSIGHDGPWPASVQGRPRGFDAGDKGGVYMWHDDGGWHVRVTHRGDRERVFSGTITTPGEISAERVLDERGDRVAVSSDHHQLRFRFENYGRVDGADFVTRCAPRLNVSVRGDGRELPTNRVFLGHRDTHPTSVPFVIERSY